MLATAAAAAASDNSARPRGTHNVTQPSSRAVAYSAIVGKTVVAAVDRFHSAGKKTGAAAQNNYCRELWAAAATRCS